MQAAFFQPQCQSCRLWLLMAYKGRHCLLVTSASLQNVKKKKRRRCCCGSSSPRTTTPLLPEERSPFSGFLLCFSGDYQLTCAAASSKGEGKYASSKQLLQRVARQLLQLLRWLQVLLWCHWSLWPFISASTWSVSVRRPQSVLIHSSRKSSRGHSVSPLLLAKTVSFSPCLSVLSWKRKNSVPVVCTPDISSPRWKIRI